MANFIADPSSPDFVYAPNGLLVERSALGPGDTVVPSPGAAPAPVAAPAPAAPAGLGVTGVGAVGAPLESVAPMPAAQATAVARGTSARTAAELAAKRDAVLGPAMATTTSTTTQSAVPGSVLNPVMARGTARAESQAGAIEQAGEARAGRQEESAMADTAAAFGRQQMAEQQRQEAMQRAEIARQNELALSLQKDPSIDPDRFIRSMSTGQSIGTVLLGALNGAFKGLVGQQGNDVLDILQRRVAQDIDSQKEQIASGRVRRGNLIQYFRDQGLREAAAEKAAEATSWAMLDRMLQAEQKRIGAGEHRTEAGVLAEAVRAQAEQRNDELKLSLGTPRSTTTVQTAPMTGGGGPSAAEVFSKLTAAREAYEKAGATPDQLKAFDGAMGYPTPGGESETARAKREAAGKQTEDEGKATAAIAALDNYGAATGLARDPNTGKWTTNGKILKDGTFGDAFRGSPVEAAQTAAIESFGRLQSGGVISPDEAKRFGEMIGSAVRADTLVNQMNAIESIIRPRMKAEGRALPNAPAGWR